MKLFLKRNPAAENIIFIIYDELGNEKYKVTEKKTKANTSYLVQNTDGKAVCKIRKLPLVSTNSYVFRFNKKSITFVCVPIKNDIKCRYYGINRHIKGDIISKNFSIVEVDNSVVATHNRILSDYEINIINEPEELFAVATAVCINLINIVDKRVTLAV